MGSLLNKTRIGNIINKSLLILLFIPDYVICLLACYGCLGSEETHQLRAEAFHNNPFESIRTIVVGVSILSAILCLSLSAIVYILYAIFSHDKTRVLRNIGRTLVYNQLIVLILIACLAFAKFYSHAYI